jgi:mono/diheme cytochrome c family protein
VFVAEPAANLVSRIVLSDDGTRLQARKAYPRGEFLASTDERFRPVYLSNAPDGTLYIVDMYRGILEHRLSMTEYLRDQILARKLEQPTGHGRIYRVVHETTRRDTPRALTALSRASPAELAAALSHPNGWWRDNAQRLLVERRPRAAIPALARLTESAPDWRVRLHALWTLDGIDAIEPAVVARALDDRSRDVRAAAVRLAERWLGRPNHPLHAAVLKRLQDTDWAVQRQLAASLGVLPASERDAAVISLLEAHADDPVTLDAALSGLRGAEAAVLEKLMRDGSGRTPQRDASITMLSATIVRSAQETAIQDLFAWIADRNRTEWQRSALLLGTEVALLGTAMPGTPAPRTAATETTGPTPCPTCPGGRAGPGGAYAYTRPAAPSPEAGASGGGRGGARLQLNREPMALTGLAASDHLATRVAGVLARIAWPGKPGDAAPMPSLTADEQRRFEAGREIYRDICQACHQPDGRGEDRRAPTLIGARFTLGPAEIATRILLNGKEGTVGLMPPVGSKLSDDQIASVLTYVRREWGQNAAPVDADMVKAVRALSAGRSRPWTDDELIKLADVPKR